MNDRMEDPLLREWLPDPTSSPSGDDLQFWEWRLQRLMAAAEPRLQQLRQPRPWWSVLGALWRPAAVAAVTAAAALVFLVPAGREPLPSGTLALNVVATEGSPAGLWAGLGGEAEPVLALIALEGSTP